MSTRALAALAAALLLLLALSASLAARRFHWFERIEPVRWRLQNSVLDAQPGQRVLLRPMLAKESEFQLFISHVERDPDPRNPPWRDPYLAYGLAERTAGSDEFLRGDAGFLPVANLGALSTGEWVQEIAPVLERLEGGGTRMALRLACGQEQGGAVLYFFDPERPAPPLGWYRQEIVVPGRPVRVTFARPLD